MTDQPVNGRFIRQPVASAFKMSFALLCGLHALLVIAAARLPQNIESMQIRQR